GRILKRLVQNLYLLPQSAIRGEVNGMPGAGCAAEPSFLREPAAAKAWGRTPASAQVTSAATEHRTLRGTPVAGSGIRVAGCEVWCVFQVIVLSRSYLVWSFWLLKKMGRPARHMAHPPA